MGLVKQYFTSNGNWVAPAGITNVLLIGAGGGGGGAKGGTSNTSWAGGGGGGSQLMTAYVPVTPNTTYAVVIGTGGAGATSSGSANAGGNTTFGSLMTFVGAGGGWGQDNCWSGGSGINQMYAYAPWGGSTFTGDYLPPWQTPGSGGTSSRNVISNVNPLTARGSTNYNAGGAAGGSTGTFYGGGGGGGGPQGSGAAGGTGNSSTTGGAGYSAADNTGAGGGGGGCGNGAGGNGGNGGSGFLYVLFWD